MDQAARLLVYQAQVQNVRAIDKARIQINRTINAALGDGNVVLAQVHTKALALVFCAWVEAHFSKVIHTPYGFTLNEIEQIKTVYNANGLEKGWENCIDLGLRKVVGRSNYKPNVRQRVLDAVHEFVVKPSLLRNKIAHGQWEIALNRGNTALNPALSKSLADLDVVAITKWFGIHEHLVRIVEALIESPGRAFHKDYWIEIAALDAFLKKSSSWTLAAKVTALQRRRLKP